MKLSMLPLLIFVELFAIWFVTQRARRLDAISRAGSSLINVMLVLLAIWAVVSSYLAITEWYQSDWFLASWPAFWVGLIPFVIVMAPLVVSKGARNSVRAILDVTPLHWMVGFQGLRVLAIGGVIKALGGEFSRYFGLYIGVPDMIFGATAFVMAWLVYSNRVGPATVAAWNVIGATIIVPVGLVLIQMGLPGPWHTFADTPTIVTIFEFPMALALTVVVPIFVLMNLLVSVRLIETIVSKDQALSGNRSAIC